LTYKHVLMLFALMWTIVFAVSVFAEAQTQIIVHPQNAVNSISREDLKQIFLGNKTRWKNKDKIVFAVLNDRELYPLFLKNYVGKSLSQYITFWKMQVFNGMGRMPPGFKNQADLIRFVVSSRGAIGFIRFDAVSDKPIKIIQVIE